MTGETKNKPLPELAAEIQDLRLQAEKNRRQGKSLAAYAAELDLSGLLTEYSWRKLKESRTVTA